MNYLLKLASLIARPPGETRTLVSRRNVLSKKALAVVMLGSLVVFLAPYVGRQWQDFNNIGPSVAIPADSWRVVYEDSKVNCNPVTDEQKECFAHPSNRSLWDSPYRRSDAAHVEKTRALVGKVFWVGAVIPSEIVQDAAQKNAFNLMIGYMGAKYQIWINGQSVFSGTEKAPWLLAIPIEPHLRNINQPLSIGIRIIHDADFLFPDFFLGTTNSGFATHREVFNRNRYNEYRFEFRFLVTAGIELLIGLFFLFLWSSNTKRMEYFYVTLVAITYVFKNMLFSKMVSIQMDRIYLLKIVFLATFFGGVFEMMLAFSFARLRRDVFIYLSAVLLTFPIMVLFHGGDSAALITYNRQIEQYFLPVFCWTGVVACWLQASSITLGNERSLQFRQRQVRLFVFGILMLILGVYYLVQPMVPLNDQYGIVYNFLHVGLLIALCSLMLRDYRDQEIRVEKFSWSKHFNGELIPVEGVFARLDLIGSEGLPAKKDERSNYSAVLSEIRLRFGDKIRERGGTVLFSEGDEMIAVFDDREVLNAELSAISAIQDLANLAEYLGEQFIEQRRIYEKRRIAFRAGLVRGAVVPYVEIGSDGVQHPKWRDRSVDSGPLVLSKRIMELERNLEKRTVDSVLIVSGEISNRIEESGAPPLVRWEKRLVLIENSKGQQYCVSFCRLYSSRQKSDPICATASSA